MKVDCKTSFEGRGKWNGIVGNERSAVGEVDEDGDGGFEAKRASEGLFSPRI